MEKHPSYRRRSGSPDSFPGGSSNRSGRITARPDPRAILKGAADREKRQPPGGKGNPRRHGGRHLSRLLRLAQFVAYTLLLILTARVVFTGWDAVEKRRVGVSLNPGIELSTLQPPSVVTGGQERRPDAILAGAVERAVDPANGITAVYVKNLNSGASAGMEEDRVFPTASLFKIPILVELLRQQSLGMVDMKTPVLLQQKHWAEGSGVLQAQIGSSFTVQQLVDYMIGVSDNTAALALLDLIGTDNVNLTLQANGLEVTRLRIGWPAKNWGGQPGESTTTAREMGTLLEKIATGKILNPKSSEDAIRFLSQKQQVAWLPVQLPLGIQVAHKSGELLGVRHDVGIVYAPHGPFVAVVLTKNITDYDGAADTISTVARGAYDYFEQGRR